MKRMTMEERRKYAQRFVIKCMLEGVLSTKVDELIKVWETDIDNTILDCTTEAK
jgi:hypothetical protein